MVGDCPELGDWDVLKAPLLNDSAFPEWQITLDGRQLKFPFEYKFVIVRTHQREVVAWETGENRICREKPQNPSEAVVVSGLRFNGSESQWRGAGTAIPVFSLRTDYGFGIGEFIDLKYLVDWALRTGQSFIQLLPVNDTTMSGTWQDSYPYNANSTFCSASSVPSVTRSRVFERRGGASPLRCVTRRIEPVARCRLRAGEPCEDGIFETFVRGAGRGYAIECRIQSLFSG